MSDEEQTQMIKRYMAWVEKLQSEKRLKGGSEVHPAHRDLKTVNGKIVVDGPFPETKEVLTGYFVIMAKDLDEAVEVSKECPALAHGDWVQVYEVPNRD
ncbi:MAG: YciI family protein [Pseudobdellovibrionaceae bacterium]